MSEARNLHYILQLRGRTLNIYYHEKIRKVNLWTESVILYNKLRIGNLFLRKNYQRIVIMSTADQQQAAIRRLESLFRDVKLEQLRNNPELIKQEIKIDKYCEIHGKHAKENCWNRRGSLSNVHQPGKDSFVRQDIYSYGATSPTRRGSLGLPMSPPKRELHPSSFPSTLRKDPLDSSVSAISHTKKNSPFFSNTIGGSPLRRDPIGRSMGCLKKDMTSNYNAPLKRDYVAKSMMNLQRPGSRCDNQSPRLASLFTSTTESRTYLKNDLNSSNGELKARSYSNGNLKSCLAGSSGNLRSNLNVTLTGDPSASSIGGLKKDGKLTIPLSNRRGSYDKRRLSTDSLDNPKRNSWDPGRRGSSGSSGGWDDPIWEEGSFDNRADQVMTSCLSSFAVKRPSMMPSTSWRSWVNCVCCHIVLYRYDCKNLSTNMSHVVNRCYPS